MTYVCLLKPCLPTCCIRGYITVKGLSHHLIIGLCLWFRTTCGFFLHSTESFKKIFFNSFNEKTYNYVNYCESLKSHHKRVYESHYSGQINRFSKAAVDEIYCNTSSSGFQKPVQIATSGFWKHFCDKTSYFLPIFNQ